jgi:hypothetical protein
MSANFKFKPVKTKFINNNVGTLNEIHKETMKKFYDNKKSLPLKRKELEKLINILKKTENKKITSTNDIKNKAELKIKIDNLKEEIIKIERNDDMKNYISKTSNILLNYYNITTTNNDPTDSDSDSDDEPQINDEKEVIFSEKLNKLNSINQQNKKIKKPVKKRGIISEGVKTNSIIKFLGIEEINNPTDLNRSTLQDKFLTLVNNNYSYDKMLTPSNSFCNKCMVEKILFHSEGYYACPKCGESECIVIDSEIPSHKDAINEKPKYPYKKINHLKEKLNQLQSKETVNIDENIIRIIKKELKKKRILPSQSTPPEIKKILKKYKFHEYYEHLQQIYCRISGANPVTISRDVEKKVIEMFNDMQESFMRHKPVGRSNFLNYSYILNKIFKILDMKSHAKFFNLLKSKDKLRDQDIVWHKICDDMGWDYYASL